MNSSLRCRRAIGRRRTRAPAPSPRAEEHAATVRAETTARLVGYAPRVRVGSTSTPWARKPRRPDGSPRLAGSGSGVPSASTTPPHDHAQALRGRLSSEWGTLPRHTGDLHEWAGRVAAQQAEEAPEAVEAETAVTAARQARTGLPEQQRRDRLTLLARLHGADKVRRDPDRYLRTSPQKRGGEWRASAEEARAEAAELRGLPPNQAVYLIEESSAPPPKRPARRRSGNGNGSSPTTRTPPGVRPAETDGHVASRSRTATCCLEEGPRTTSLPLRHGSV